LFRFSSQGGLSVDYIGQHPNHPGTQLTKVLWKEDVIRDTKSFLFELHEGLLSGQLQNLVDSVNPHVTYPKAAAFPLAPGHAGTGAYQQVMGTSEMTTEQPNGFTGSF